MQTREGHLTTEVTDEEKNVLLQSSEGEGDTDDWEAQRKKMYIEAFSNIKDHFERTGEIPTSPHRLKSVQSSLTRMLSPTPNDEDTIVMNWSWVAAYV